MFGCKINHCRCLHSMKPSGLVTDSISFNFLKEILNKHFWTREVSLRNRNKRNVLHSEACRISGFQWNNISGLKEF